MGPSSLLPASQGGCGDEAGAAAQTVALLASVPRRGPPFRNLSQALGGSSVVRLLSLMGTGAIRTLTVCERGQAALTATVLEVARCFRVCKTHQYFTSSPCEVRRKRGLLMVQPRLREGERLTQSHTACLRLTKTRSRAGSLF